jgi:outer membrane protein assembly factor BamB
VLAAVAQAGDWPQWRGPVRTGHAGAGEKPLSALPAEPKVVWRVKTGAGWASPVVAAGKVFYADNQDGQEVLHAVNATDGHELWRAKVDAVMHDEQGPDGPRGTPLVEGGHVYVQSCLGELQCRQVADGALVWRSNFRKDFGSPWLGEDSVIPGASEHGYTGSPVLAGGLLIAGVGSTNGAGVVAFDRLTGAVRWHSQNDLAAYAAPVVARIAGVEQVVCFTVEGLLSLAPADGHVLWRVPLKTSYGRNCLTPLVVGDRVLTGSYQAGLIAVQVTSAEGGLRAVPAWTNAAVAMNFTSPVAADGFLYGVGPAKNLVCVEAASGRVAWSREGYFTAAAGSTFAALLVVGPNLLLQTDGGQAVLFAADASACRELGRTQVCGKTWSHPAYADGRLYVQDGLSGKGSLRCVELATP